MRKPTPEAKPPSSSTPTERLQKYLAEQKNQKKERASSATSKASSKDAVMKGALKNDEKEGRKEKVESKATPVMKVNKGGKFEKCKSKSKSAEDKGKERKTGKKKGEKRKEDEKVKEEERSKAKTKEKDVRKKQATETEKKPDQPGTTDKKNVKETSMNKKKDEEKIKFVPSQKKKVEHIFNTPPAKTSHSPGSTSSMTSKQRAEMHLRSLGDLLEASDDESVSATDMDEFLSEIAAQGKETAALEAKTGKTCPEQRQGRVK